MDRRGEEGRGEDRRGEERREEGSLPGVGYGDCSYSAYSNLVSTYVDILKAEEDPQSRSRGHHYRQV